MTHSDFIATESQAATGARSAHRGSRAGRALGGAGALLFAAAATETVLMWRAMPDGMDMPGGWTMSMAWMRMPGQGWTGATLMFMGMRSTMMATMMLPALLPSVHRYYADLAARGNAHPAGLTAIAAAAYFFVWACAGVAIYPVGVGLALLLMRLPDLSRLLPALAGAVVIVAGLFQFTPWKISSLCRCRGAIPVSGKQNASAASRHGLLLGANCVSCSWPLMAMLLATDLTNLVATLIATVAIAAERIAPRPELTARVVGAAMAATSMLMLGGLVP